MHTAISHRSNVVIHHAKTSPCIEKKVGRITYRVTSVFLGETSLKDSLERLAVRKVLDEINAGTKEIVSA